MSHGIGHETLYFEVHLQICAWNMEGPINVLLRIAPQANSTADVLQTTPTGKPPDFLQSTQMLRRVLQRSAEFFVGQPKIGNDRSPKLADTGKELKMATVNACSTEPLNFVLKRIFSVVHAASSIAKMILGQRSAPLRIGKWVGLGRKAECLKTYEIDILGEYRGSAACRSIIERTESQAAFDIGSMNSHSHGSVFFSHILKTERAERELSNPGF